MESRLLRNPFHVLGAGPRDGRHRILELAEERSLSTEADICRQARADLMSPRNRLAAEIGWLPGVEAGRSAQLLRLVRLGPASLRNEPDLPALAHANLLAGAWDCVPEDESPANVAAFISETAAVLGRVSAAETLRGINADRAVSGFPIVSSEQQVQAELAARMAEIGSIVNAALNRLPTSDLVDAMTAAAGEGSAFIDDLVDRHYEVGTRAFLEEEAAIIMSLIEAAKRRAWFGEAALNPFLGKIEEVLRNWQRAARPILISARTRGINHKPAADLAGSVRELSIHLHNEHHMYAAMKRLTALLIECFAELPQFHARLQEDADFLQGNASDYQAWAGRISLRAEIGLLKKDILSICPSGVAWNDAHYALKSISRIRFGGVRFSPFALMGIPSYVVAIGDSGKETAVRLTSASLYDAFIEKLWRAVGSRLMTDLYTSLKAGKAVQFAAAIVHDDGIELPRRKLSGKREFRRYAWKDVKTWNYNAQCYIASTVGKRHMVRLAYRNVPNAGVLSSAINAARKKPGLRNLSELLDGG